MFMPAPLPKLETHDLNRVCVVLLCITVALSDLHFQIAGTKESAEEIGTAPDRALFFSSNLKYLWFQISRLFLMSLMK
jgi:hypothetical protein